MKSPVNWGLVASFVGTVIIPLLYLLNIIIISQTPNSVSFPQNLKILGILIAVVGLIFWILSYMSLGNSFGVLPQKQKKVTRGIYKYFDHPMYMGIWLTFFGLSLAKASWQGLVFLNLILTPLFFIRAVLEESKLEK
ncbi:DUF1295 domain-containing protein [Patescibacteria group bacterium]|nr:DUF1295 domain-containing protein [Patescibacteria group bacterium]